MAKPSKIEKLGLQADVARLVADGKSPRAIAPILSKIAKTPISHMAVDRYLKGIADQDASPAAPVNEVHKEVRRQPRTIQKIIERDLDIISLQYRTTAVLLDRFETIAEAPNSFEQRMEKVVAELREKGDETTSLEAWAKALTDDLRRNVQSVATLNRELRENSKFMFELREKAFNFDLVQEFISIYMDIFRQEAPEAHERAMAKIASNPRLERIVEQQKEMRGYEET